MPERPSELITKRLHVSGLTAALSSHDLERRLAAFGTVTALDGFGKLDVLGQPRKFAYVTLETTKSQLSRCMQNPSCLTLPHDPSYRGFSFVRHECTQWIDMERHKATHRRSKT